MRSARLRWAALVAVALLAAACGDGDGDGAAGEAGAGTLRVSGSTTVNPVAADAAEVLRGRGTSITVDSQGGSAGGIAQLAAGQVEIAMSSKEVTAAERSRFPDVDFVATEIGRDAVGVVVRREVHDGGVRDLDRDRVRALFEGRVRNWRELGGPDVEVFVYDKEPGRGTREVLDAYLYGKGGTPPPPPSSDRYAVVGGNEETRSKLLSTPGSVAPLSFSFVAGHPQLAAVAVDGVAPTVGTARDGSYPLSRPLFLVTDGPPAGAAKRFVDFVLSPEGQELVRRHGYVGRHDVGAG